MNRDHAREIRESLVNPLAVCEQLGLIGTKNTYARQAGGGVSVRCPNHDERTPSCSVTRGHDGTIRVRCFGCQWTGDVLTLIGKARGLDFRETLVEAARMAGRWDVLDELEHPRPEAERAARPAPAKAPVELPPEPTYPPATEVADLIARSEPCTRADVAAYLTARGLEPEAVGELGGRALPAEGALPRWARYRGETWRETGHRLVIPVYDAQGLRRSVRVARVTDGESPKRLPPAGHKAAELVMADSMARAMLSGAHQPERLLIVEGEPDFLTAATHGWEEPVAVLGIVSGSWSPAFTMRVPRGCRVSIWTHADAAGDAYAAQMVDALRRWRGCRVHRWNPKEAA